MKKITRHQIENLPVPMPSIFEQRALAARLQSEFEQAQTLREHLAQKLAAVEKLPAALLREAFGGRP